MDKNRMRFLGTMLAILAVFPLSMWSGPEFNQEEAPPRLEKILAESADYCDRLSEVVLDFVCRENIKEEASHNRPEMERLDMRALSSGRSAQMFDIRHKERISSRFREGPHRTSKEKNLYVYDYQLIKKGDTIDESRTLLRENGKRRNEKNALLKTKHFYSKRAIFGPIGLLSRKQQEKYNYQIIGSGRVLGKKAIVIEAVPKEPDPENPNFGKIWLDEEDFSVLRIDVAQESLAGMSESKTWDIRRDVFVSHLYDFEKNGIRFPSRTVFEEDYRATRVESVPRQPTHTKTKSSLKWAKVEIDYSRYKFFTVDWDVRYDTPY